MQNQTTVPYWASKLCRLISEPPRELQIIAGETPAEQGITDQLQEIQRLKGRWPLDFSGPATRLTVKYGQVTDGLAVWEYLRSLYCVTAITHAIRYLAAQDERRKQIGHSPIPMACFSRLCQLCDSDESAGLVSLLEELGEHIELGSNAEWQAVDCMFADSLRICARRIVNADSEEIIRMLEMVVR